MITTKRILRPLIVLALVFATAIVQAEQTWTLNSKEMDINKLILSVANATGKTIIVDRKVKGNVQVISSKPLNKQQYYELFLSILEVHGYTAIESGDVVRVIPSKNARSSPVAVSDARPRNSSKVITQVIQLNNVSAAKLIPVLRPLAPQEAHMAAYSGSNAIIISDTSSNIARIRKIIEKVDRSAEEKTEVIRLKYAAADEMVKMLTQLDRKQGGKNDVKELVLIADKRTNSILVSGDQMKRERIKYLVQSMDTPQTQSGNAKVIYLEYANAVDMAKVLSKVVQNISQTTNGKTTTRTNNAKATIEADEGTNALIITAESDMMQSLMTVIQRLDIRRAQVLVEAIIVEVQDDGNRNLGLDWLFLNENNGYGSFTSNPSRSQAIANAAFQVEADLTGDNQADPRLNLSQALTSSTGGLIGLGRLREDLSFNVVLNALYTSTNANILSTPSLLTLDNEEASIVVGQNIPFITGSYTSTGNSSNPNNPFQTVERQNVGLTLKITPSINEGDTMVLEIEQESSNVLSQGDLGPTTQERKIATKVLAGDGKTIVLGGLISDSISDTTNKVPVLGDIPIMGHLFKNRGSRMTKQHLLVFLKPTIVRSNEQMNAATAEKYRQIRNKQMRYSESANSLFRDYEMPLIKEWEDDVKQLNAIRDRLSQGQF